MDTAKTSTLEGAATTVYAQGGKGNPRLIAWEGEKTLTFTIEEALLSDVSLSMLTGAGLMKVGSEEDVSETYVHSTFDVAITTSGEGSTTTLKAVLPTTDDLYVSNLMPAYGVILDDAGSAKIYLENALAQVTGEKAFTIPAGTGYGAGDIIRIDCYVTKTSGKIINIAADEFAGYYYIEASTLFRDEATGQDFPAEFVIPRGKIQSNFTFTMAASGDPSEQMRMAA